MKNETQLERYKMLIKFIDEQYKEEIDIPKIEEVSIYSYRNINRIFLALHQETIGKYIRRIRLEKAAQFLKYSNRSISDIAFEIGYMDVAIFSKAFKLRFGITPSAYRDTQESLIKMESSALNEERVKMNLPRIDFEVEILPDFDFMFLEYRGSYSDAVAINKTWNKLLEYAAQLELLDDNSILMAEILDDNDITDDINCRYNACILLRRPIQEPLDGLFQSKKHRGGKYVKFIHKGQHKNMDDTYNKIYANWMIEIKHEFADKPTLEFYINDEEDTSKDDLLTEIYIPII